MPKNIVQITNLVTTLSDATLLYAAPPGSGGYGFVDAKITKANFFKPLQDQIDDTDDNVVILEDSVTALEELNKLQRNLNLSSSTSFTLPQNGLIREVYITVVNGAPAVLVGTTAGAGDILDIDNIDGYASEDIIFRSTVSGGNSPAQTIHYTVTGGSVHIHTIYRILSTV